MNNVWNVDLCNMLQFVIGRFNQDSFSEQNFICTYFFLDVLQTLTLISVVSTLVIDY